MVFSPPQGGFHCFGCVLAETRKLANDGQALNAPSRASPNRGIPPLRRRIGAEPGQRKRRFPPAASDAGTLVAETKGLLRKYGLRARKSLGQNFLIDEEVLAQIVTAALLRPSDLVVEVGPGLGVLTKELAGRAGRVIAVEIDANAVCALREILAGLSNVDVWQADVLEVDPAELVRAGGLGSELVRMEGIGSKTIKGFKVVANLPYYITSLVLRHFLEATARPECMVLMLQKEVAERIVAKPGNMSLLSISVQVYGQPQIIAYVPASSFFPAPKVDSALVRIDVFLQPVVPEKELVLFFEVVHAGFSQPRKQLHNAIAESMWLPPGGAADLLRSAGVAPERRAQTLSLAEWQEIARQLENLRGRKPDEDSHQGTR